MSHRLDANISNLSDDAILKRLMDNPARIPMLDMRSLVDLREKGFVICGQEMENCIAIHAHDGDRIIEGTPTTFAWVVITPKGREHLHSQGYMVPDKWGTVKVPRASMVVIERRLHEADLPGEIIPGPGVFEPLILPMDYKVPSPSLMQTLDDMERARMLAAAPNGEDLED